MGVAFYPASKPFTSRNCKNKINKNIRSKIHHNNGGANTSASASGNDKNSRSNNNKDTQRHAGKAAKSSGGDNRDAGEEKHDNNDDEDEDNVTEEDDEDDEEEKNIELSRKNAGVLVIPGGGYSFVSLDYEGADTVRWLNARGFDAWVLDYTTTCTAAAPLYPAPLDEAADAVRAVRARIDRQLRRKKRGERRQQKQQQQQQKGKQPAGAAGDGDEGKDKDSTTTSTTATSASASTSASKSTTTTATPPYRLGLWGFSAGAHLAALTLTRPDLEPLLDFAVLAYPVVSMTAEDNDGDIVVAHLGSRRNLLGDGSTGSSGDFVATALPPTPSPSSLHVRSFPAKSLLQASSWRPDEGEEGDESEEGDGEGGHGGHGTGEPSASAHHHVAELQRRMSPHRGVGPRTPPAFIFHTANDPAVPVQNALLFAGAMARHARPFQLLVLPDGPHGISLAVDDPKLSWTPELERWLRYSIGVMR